MSTSAMISKPALFAVLISISAGASATNNNNGNNNNNNGNNNNGNNNNSTPVIVVPASASYTFSDSTTNGFPDLKVGTLTIAQVGANTKWTLSTTWNAATYSSAFVKSLDFTLPNNTVLSDFHVLSGTVGMPSVSKNGLGFATANTTARFDGGEQVNWVFEKTIVAEFSGLNKLQMHINAIYNGASVKFSTATTTPVPEAHTWAMLLAGLALMGVVARRRRA